MKVKKKRKNQVQKARKSRGLTHKTVNINITSVSQELVPLLLGMELLFNQSAFQHFKNLRLWNEKEIEDVMFFAGYIKGNHEKWWISGDVLKKVFERLSKIPRNRSTFGYERLSKSPPIFVLVRTWKRSYRVLERATKIAKDSKQDKFVLFRRLCQVYRPEVVLDCIQRFFKLNLRNYSTDNFVAYLEKNAPKIYQ